MANDMELGIETKVEGEIVERGVIALDAKIFSDIVRKLPDNDVTIETDDSFKTVISCEKAKFNIIGKSGDDFSYIPYIEKNESIVISQFSLKEIVRQTIFSIADNDNNKLMTGELFEIEDNRLKVVSLDGHRISIRYMELKNSYEHKKVVVPGKTLNEISKIIPGNVDEDVVIYFSNNHVVFDFDSTTVVSRLIEGEYFKIDQMLSSDYETKIKINKKELLDCIDRSTLLVKEGDKKPIIMNVTDSSMELKINSFIGSMNEDIDIEKEGKDIMIGFNPKFFIDALRVIDEETVNLYMVNPKAPCFIKDDEGKFIYLILPVNFNNVSN
jgi:DNA polymerase-3 subunit beta